MKWNSFFVFAWTVACIFPAPSVSWCGSTENEKAVEIESITVTANKMEEEIQDVPQSITVIDEAVLDEKGIQEIPDIIQEIPNMKISTGVYGNSVSFRGLNPSMFTNNNPVVLYIDGVPTTDAYSFDALLANVERIEVLRGPQGALYGKDAIGGVINIVTKTPTNEWQGKVGAEYGRYNFMQGLFNASGGLIEDKLYFGLNGQYRQDDGWIENTHAGMDSNADESQDRRISGYFLYNPTEKLSARLTLSDDYGKESWLKGYALPAGSDFDDFNRDDAETVDFDVPTDVEQESFSQSLHLSYAFDPLTLTSTTTHKKFQKEGDYDADFSTNPLFEDLKQFDNTDLDAYTQEFRLSGNNKTGIRWVGGVYFDAEEREQGPYGMQFPMSDPVTYAFLGNYEMNAESQTDSSTYAVFGQVIVPLGQRFELTLGGRYQHISKEIDLKMYYLPVGMSGPAMFSYSAEKDWNVFLPKTALDYSLSDHWNIYVSYSQGYMPGGFNYFATSGTAEDNSFEPQQSKNYEVGIKGTMERLRVAASLFYMDIEDIHVFKTVGTVYLTDNAESAHSQGVELELAYRLTDTIKLTGALGIIDAQYDAYDAGSGISYDGQKIQNTPAYTATVGVSYASPGGFYSRVDMNAAGDVYFYDDANKDFVKEDGYITFDAKIGYLIGAWDFYVYGENLTDEEYIVDYISNSMLAMADFGDPLTVGAGVRYRF